MHRQHPYRRHHPRLEPRSRGTNQRIDSRKTGRCVGSDGSRTAAPGDPSVEQRIHTTLRRGQSPARCVREGVRLPRSDLLSSRRHTPVEAERILRDSVYVPSLRRSVVPSLRRSVAASFRRSVVPSWSPSNDGMPRAPMTTNGWTQRRRIESQLVCAWIASVCAITARPWSATRCRELSNAPNAATIAPTAPTAVSRVGTSAKFRGHRQSRPRAGHPRSGRGGVRARSWAAAASGDGLGGVYELVAGERTDGADAEGLFQGSRLGGDEAERFQGAAAGSVAVFRVSACPPPSTSTSNSTSCCASRPEQ